MNQAHIKREIYEAGRITTIFNYMPRDLLSDMYTLRLLYFRNMTFILKSHFNEEQ